MKQNLAFTISFIAVTLTVVYTVACLVAWWNHPELTYMQVFKRYFGFWLAIIIYDVIGYIVINKIEKE